MEDVIDRVRSKVKANLTRAETEAKLAIMLGVISIVFSGLAILIAVG